LLLVQLLPTYASNVQKENIKRRMHLPIALCVLPADILLLWAPLLLLFARSAMQEHIYQYMVELMP
jgi:hypothetical protein